MLRKRKGIKNRCFVPSLKKNDFLINSNTPWDQNVNIWSAYGSITSMPFWYANEVGMLNFLCKTQHP